MSPKSIVHTDAKHSEGTPSSQQVTAQEVRNAPDCENTVPALDNERVNHLQNLLGGGLCRRLGIYTLPKGFLLSVVVPVYNEVLTIDEAIGRIQNCGVPCEIIVVDDGSTDGTREKLCEIKDHSDVTVIFHGKNQGKGAALRIGFVHVRGQAILVQDADSEYDPAEYRYLLQPLIEDQADVVYGRRLPTSALLQASCGQSSFDVVFKHFYEFELERHGMLLQGFPAKCSGRSFANSERKRFWL